MVASCKMILRYNVQNIPDRIVALNKGGPSLFVGAINGSLTHISSTPSVHLFGADDLDGIV